MKKKMIAAFGALTIAGVIGFTTFQSGIVKAEPKLTKDEIRNQVTSQYPGTIRELELERGANIYEVEVVVDGKEYELKIHGDTGDVLKLEEKAISARAVTENDKVVTDQKTDENAITNGDAADDKKPNAVAQAPKNNSNDDVQGEKTTKSVTTNKSVAPKQTVISHAEAKRIALNNFEGTIVELELDDNDNHHTYEIEMVNGNRKAEIEIDAYTGKVIVLEIETEDDDEYEDDKYDDNN
jgi:uncharacterized membrane protein YkoI